MPKSVILVTGASSGFGLMPSHALAQAGHTVYASMLDTAGRKAPRVAEAAAWAAENGADLRTVELDVLSDASAEAAVGYVLADAGRLDVIVHNAGHMVYGPAEASTPEQLTEQTMSTCWAPSASTVPPCRTCGARAGACWSGWVPARPASARRRS